MRGDTAPQTPPEDAQDTQARRLQWSRQRIALFKCLQDDSPENRSIALDRIIEVVKSYTRDVYPPHTPSKRSSVSTETTSPSTPNVNYNGAGAAKTPVGVYNGIPVAVDGGFIITPIDSDNGGAYNGPGDDSGIGRSGAETMSDWNSITPTMLDPSIIAEFENEQEEIYEQLQHYLLTILRLSMTCPFKDVRQAFTELLKKLQEMNVPVPVPIYPSPSFFINPNDIFSLESTTSSSMPIPYPRPAGLSISPWANDVLSPVDEDEILHSDPEEMEQDGDDYAPVPGRPADEYVRMLMIKTYVDSGRLSNVSRIKAFFPTYLEKYFATMSALMKRQSGPMHRSWRSYIALMAASQHNCQYVVSIQKSEFLHHGGDPLWLKGLKYAPKKIQNLASLASLLAHQPWRIQPKHIEQLVKISDSGSSPEDRWTMNELVQAIVILATFHSLSSFVLGCGIVPEMDTRGGYYVPGVVGTNYEAGIEHELYHSVTGEGCATRTRAEREASHAACAATGWDDDSLDTPPGDASTENRLTGTASTTPSHHSSAPRSPKLFPGDYGIGLGVTIQDDDEQDPEALSTTTKLISILKKNPDISSGDEEDGGTMWPEGEKVEDESVNNYDEDDNEQSDSQYLSHSDPRTSGSRLSVLSVLTGSGASSTVSFLVPQNPYVRINPVHEDLSRFLYPNPKVSREDFDIRSDDEFSLGEYCWEDHGCDLVSQYLPGLGEALDEEFSEALNITDWSIFHASDFVVDTWPLRQAIWYYALCLFGIKKEDYVYSDINRYLNPRIQQYIKKVCCAPEEIHYSDWKNIGLSLRPEEKCHVNLIAIEARKQAELLYALYAVDNYHRG